MTRTIDLGLVGAHQPGIEGAGRTGRPRRTGGPRRRAWLAGRSWRWWPAAAVSATLLLATATAPAAPHPSGRLEPRYTLPAGDEVVFSDRTLYVVTAPDRGDGAFTVAAYRVDDGAERWQRQLTPAGYLARPPALTVEAATPLVHTIEYPAPGGYGDPAELVRPALTTVALDPVTGDLRWVHDGAPAGTAAGRVLLDSVDFNGVEGESALVAVDADTGRVAWRLRVPWLTAYDRQRVAALGADGTLTVHELGTGAELARTTVPAPPEVPRLLLVGSLVLVQSHWPEQRLTAYDRDTLAVEWTSPVSGFVQPCAGLLCVLADRVSALDPVTGRPAWPPLPTRSRTTGWTVAAPPGGAHLLLAPASAVGGSAWIVDARSGRLVRTFTGWGLVGDAGAVGQATARPAPPLLYHVTRTGTWLAGVDPSSLEMDVLGPVGDIVPAWCTASADHVACRLPEDPDRMRVWRIARR